MNTYQDTGKSPENKDKNFVLVKAGKMEPFKIEIFCEEFLDVMADIISNPGTKYNAMKQMIEEIKKPITMKLDADVYKQLGDCGDRRDIEIVCKYVAVQRIVGCVDDNRFLKMIEDVRDRIREVPVSQRHVLCGDEYKRIFGMVPAGYLCSVCNLSGVGEEVRKMDKDDERYMTKVMNCLKELTGCDEKVVGDGYREVVGLVERILFAYRDHNIIDLGNILKQMGEMFEGDLGEYFRKVMNRMQKDVSDDFRKFDDTVREMKEADRKHYEKDDVEPYEYDQVEDVSETEEQPVDLNNDGLYPEEPDMNTQPAATPPSGGEVTTGLEDGSGTAGGGGNPGGVVTGLESVILTEGILKKKLKRIGKEVIPYVKVRGANARDADELTMICSYGYSVCDRCEWYMDIIAREDDRYIVPQTYGELDYIRKSLYQILDDLMKAPFFRTKGSIYRNGLDY